VVRLNFHPAASDELVEAAAWYDARVPDLGMDLLEEVAAATAASVEAPETWPRWGTVRGESVRRFIIARFPYSIPYVVRSDRVIVLAVAHAKRRPGYWRRRLR
jgi:plasmid stabilization system protein ParE